MRAHGMAAIGITTGMMTGAVVGTTAGVAKVGGMMAGIMPTVAAAGATAIEVMRAAMPTRDMDVAMPAATVVLMRATGSALVTDSTVIPVAVSTAGAASMGQVDRMAVEASTVEADSTAVDIGNLRSAMQKAGNASCQPFVIPTSFEV